ncbi:MAG: SPFH/Band 7/PHB domain protein [Proteobacteria bacterium]|jgi:regulator of protease activity HflC (stomatin/prohibitin superfamily)|nr:SPFH/Band 7/PHB domain protein [Pseudomonadota bacterium]
MEIFEVLLWVVVLVFLTGIFAAIMSSSVKFVRPTHRALIERAGRFNRYVDSGLAICIPIIERIRLVNVTEKMVTCQRQEVITGDNLNAGVSAQVYYRIKGDEQSVKNSQYNVDNIAVQIVSLAQTTLRNVVGGLTLRDANSKRAGLNTSLKDTIASETSSWGIDVVRTEIAEIDAPADVQKAMNEIVKAESEKRAAIDFATAVETQADGKKRAAIKEAEGLAKSVTIAAEANANAITVNATAKAEAIRTVNAAANETFTGPSVTLKQLEVGEVIFKSNSKIIVPQGTNVTTLVSDLTGSEKIVPLGR